MSTPAEIIAARIAANANSKSQSHDDYDYSDPESVGNEEGVSSLASSIPSLNDESAFPTLGGGKKSTTSSSGASSWGSGSIAKSSVSASKFKPSTIQEAFSLDSDDQLNVARPEFIKILTTVKSETKTNIECTTSQLTKKRTFLITGKPEDVKVAKRLVIKKLTKPVKITFQIPSKLRSKVIGPQGKTLKPIISNYDVKVDIGNTEVFLDEDETNDDLFNKVITITIDGDVEGCKLSKNAILDIIKQETKTLSIKIPVSETLKPFASAYFQPIIDSTFKDLDILVPDYKSSKNSITIIGDRELVLEAKEVFTTQLENLSTKIVVDEVPIPKSKHQFLPIESILEEDGILIKLPEVGESNVKFVGEKSKINAAKEKARQTTSKFKIESLDMSKAHKGNLPHVKAIAGFLKKQGFFKSVEQANNVVINAPTDSQLDDATFTSIPIEVIINSTESTDENIKVAKKEIVSKVNKITPDTTKLVSDIDEFLIAKVPSTIDSICKEKNITYVIIGDKITLFGNEGESTNESEDFDDFEESTVDFDAVDKALDSLRELKANLESVTLEVTSDAQKFVTGQDNTTLKSILNEVEPNSVNVKLIPTEDKILVEGLKTQVAVVKKLIADAIKEGEEYGNKYSEVATIPSVVLSRLIGKNGQFLNSLRDEFGVKIDVDREEDEVKAEKVSINIVGIKRNVESCKAKIVSLSKRWADETTVRIKIDNQYHRRMIGPSGKFINRLQDKYNVRIRFPSATELNSSSPDSPRTKDEVTIRGPTKAVESAKVELEDLYAFEKENGFEETINIPIKAIAVVIGKSGETINDIADGVGIEYKFSRNTEKEQETGFVEVKLIGSRSSLKEAVSKIKEIISEVENFVSIDLEVESQYHKAIVGKGGSKMREIISNAGGDELPSGRYHKLLSIPNEGSGSNVVNSKGPKAVVNKIIAQINEFVEMKKASITEEFQVPKEKQRFIVGPSGSIRQSLEEEFNVSIDVPRADNNATTVKLTGLPQNIDSLKVKLQELIKDDWNDSIDVPEIYHGFVSDGGQIFRLLKSKYGVEVTHDNLQRKASKLSNISIPAPPSESLPTEEETTKFIVSEITPVGESSNVIPWRLKGEKEATSKVLELLTKKLELAKQSNCNGWFYAAKPSVFSKLIGPQGSTIKSLREKTNAFIHVPKSSDNNSNYVYLIGTADNLEKAKDSFKKLI